MKRAIACALILMMAVFAAGCGGVQSAASGNMLERANELAGQEKYDDAISVYKMICDFAPRDPEAYLRLADVYTKQGDAAQAVAILVQGLKATGGDSALSVRLQQARAALSGAASPEPSPAGQATAEALYLAYVRDVLVPQYGLSNLEVIRYLHDSAEPLGTDDRALGLMCAQMADLDGDGVPELVTAVCEARRTNPSGNADHTVILMVYACKDGKVARVPGPEDGLVSVASDEGSAYFGNEYALDLRMGGGTLIYSHFTSHGGDTDWETFQAFRMENGALREVLDAVNMIGAGEYGVVARILPDWLEKDFSGVARQHVDAYGKNSVLLFADKPSAEESFYVFPGAYRAVYQSQQAAVDALLRPIANAPIKELLNPVWRDHTGMCAWLQIAAPTFTPPAPTPSPTPEAGTLGDFILAGKQRAYSYWELDAYTQDEVALIRNGMYALSGKIFTKKENQAYFSQFGWYTPVSENVDRDLNAYQRANIELCARYEKDRGWR